MRFLKPSKTFVLTTLLTLTWGIFSQVTAQVSDPPPARSDFWNHVRIGGGLGLGFGSGFTDITVAPSAIYEFNQYVSAGIGLSGSYVRYRRYSPEVNEYRSWIYGGSIIGLFHPIPQIQVSLELEQLRVNTTLETVSSGDLKDNFWNTGFFVGAGYRNHNVTIGLRYNILHDPDRTVYGDALMPFVRVYF